MSFERKTAICMLRWRVFLSYMCKRAFCTVYFTTCWFCVFLLVVFVVFVVVFFRFGRISLVSKQACIYMSVAVVVRICANDERERKSIECGYIVDNLLVSLEVESSIKLSAFAS